MSPVRVTWLRTLGMARNFYATALALGAFWAGTAICFCVNVELGEGGRLALGELWAVSLSPVLPMLASFLAMDVWSDERLSGRAELLLSAPVSELELVMGKFLGVCTMMAAAILTSWFTVWGTLAAMDLEIDFPVLAVTALLVQSALWSAVGLMMSARFRHAAAAAMAALTVTVIIPRALWFAAVSWLPERRLEMGQMILDAHVLDMASGVVSTGMLLGYAVLTVLALVIAVRYVMILRFAGHSARMYRRSARLVIFLSIVAAALTLSLAMRLNATLELPVGAAREFSSRTRSILAGAEGEVEAAAFLPRSDRRFRETVFLLRALKREAEQTGGLKLSLKFVDPRWDLGEAERLVRQGGKSESVVLRRARRTVSVPIADGLGERELASAILQLVANPHRKTVYWTEGHGEAEFDRYDVWGMSDIARELARDGYVNRKLALSKVETVPEDCALVVVAAAKTDFSRTEIARLETYLMGGGRMLAMLENAEAAGVGSLLPMWGVKPVPAVAVKSNRTVSGSDLIITEFGDHAITEPLKGTQLILDSPVAMQPSAAAEAGAGADKVGYVPLAMSGGQTFAAVGERGAGTGSDLALRPTRVAVVGDALFAMNGQLAARKNANCDFFLNIVAYLSGADAMVGGGLEPGVLTLPFDRRERIRAAATMVVGVPLALFLAMIAYALKRSHRS
ncbi:MAG: Gldg family protein [Kiritimatiellae bacterium]|nr:Gldg family protein [Kiritimatiellia bacterium]